ncbi:hypothetical protein PLICRDRAFT_179553 [Plicaturopsis crispa FD-325 SS-3]|uniref:Uncharacterized protein n=1 Tax=Plicaturopsis crispa FD-325 SS-3 TaxID=944288 RepID=A0A0C9SXD7_PLICR|nr:hypothetical protein PLICRDRAFT_179553 [Plicaturopsis crispa FD-325 SS-3]
MSSSELELDSDDGRGRDEQDDAHSGEEENTTSQSEDEDDEDRSGGDFFVTWGKYRDKPMNHCPLDWIRWCMDYFKGRNGFPKFDDAAARYLRYVEEHPGVAIIPFGKKHKDQRLQDCRDLDWIHWCCAQRWCRERFPLWRQAAQRWLVVRPRRVEMVKRDVGQRLTSADDILAPEDYADDVGEVASGEPEEDEDLEDFIVPDEDTDEENESWTEEASSDSESEAAFTSEESSDDEAHSSPDERRTPPARTRNGRSYRLGEVIEYDPEDDVPLTRLKRKRSFVDTDEGYASTPRAYTKRARLASPVDTADENSDAQSDDTLPDHPGQGRRLRRFSTPSDSDGDQKPPVTPSPARSRRRFRLSPSPAEEKPIIGSPQSGARRRTVKRRLIASPSSSDLDEEKPSPKSVRRVAQSSPVRRPKVEESSDEEMVVRPARSPPRRRRYISP